MKQGKKLSHEELCKLTPSDKKYFVSSENMYVDNGVYTLTDTFMHRGEGYMFLGEGNYLGCFSPSSESVLNGKIDVYELV